MRRHNKKIRNIIIFSLLVLVLILLSLGGYYYNKKREKVNKEVLEKEIRDSYNEYVVTKNDCLLYDDNLNEIGKLSKNVYLELDKVSDYSSKYFKLKNYDMYIKYNDIIVADKHKEDTRYQNYIPFNKSVITNKNTQLFIDNDTYYIINEELELPIIIDDLDKYYVSFDNKLVYVNKNNASVIENNNSDLESATSIAVLNYHFVINKEAGEDKICEPSSICHTDTQFDSHIKYIIDSGFYTITMKELEMFIDGKINLPKKSVSITIDDGWFVYRAIPILEKYNAMGTLFLIGSLAPVSDYASNNLEIHSHTWNLHNISTCSEGRSALLCYDKNKLVEDLKKSRENLNNTTYFCYPFYEYNNHAIESLKEAGFTMALTGGNNKVTRGIDKFKVPRYVIYNTTTVDSIAKMLG